MDNTGGVFLSTKAEVEKAIDEGCSLADLGNEFPDKDKAYLGKIHKQYLAGKSEAEEKENKQAEGSKGDYKAQVPKETDKQKKEGESIDEAVEEGEEKAEESTGTSEKVILGVLGAGVIWAFWPMISERLLPGKSQKPMEDW